MTQKMTFDVPCEVVVLCLSPGDQIFFFFGPLWKPDFSFISRLNPKSLQSLFSTMWESALISLKS